MEKIDRAEYPYSDGECPHCGWDMIDTAFDPDGDPTFVEADRSDAPPDVQSTYYKCYSAVWFITCSNCGTKFASYYDNY